MRRHMVELIEVLRDIARALRGIQQEMHDIRDEMIYQRPQDYPNG